MKRSSDRIRTTHAGRLPVPPGCEGLPMRLFRGEKVEPVVINAGIDQQLARDWSVSVSYQRRQHRNGLGILDRARPAEAYAPINRTYTDVDGQVKPITIYNLRPEFVNLRDAGDPVELAVRYQDEGADEVVFLDITASHEKRDTVAELARRCADDLFIPFTIGGGVRSAADAQEVLDAGAEKVSVNSAAVARPELLGELDLVDLSSRARTLAEDFDRRQTSRALAAAVLERAELVPRRAR